MSKDGWLYCLGYGIVDKYPQGKERFKKTEITSPVVKKDGHLEPTKLFHTIFKSIPLIFYKEGLLAIGTDNQFESDVISNIFKYLLHCDNYVFHKAKGGFLIYYNSKYEIDFSVYRSYPCDEKSLRPLTVIDLKEYVKTALKIYKDDVLKDDVMLLVNAMDLRRNTQASFIFNWLIIERKLYRLWENEVMKLTRNAQKIKYFTNSNGWPINRVMELESLFGFIKEESFERYKKYKIIRNKLSHGKITPIDESVSYQIGKEAEFIVYNDASIKLKKYGLFF